MSLLGSAGDTALRNLTQPKEGAAVIAGLTWDELDRLVDDDPIALRDRAWEEIQQLRAVNAQLRVDLVERDDLSGLLRGMARRAGELRRQALAEFVGRCTAEQFARYAPIEAVEAHRSEVSASFFSREPMPPIPPAG